MKNTPSSPAERMFTRRRGDAEENCHPGRALTGGEVGHLGAIRDPLRNLDCGEVGPGSSRGSLSLSRNSAGMTPSSPRLRVSACQFRLGMAGAIASILLIGALFSVGAVAAPDCKTVMPSAEYFINGGKLNHLKMRFHALPPQLECHRIACPGRVRFSTIIDTEGQPRDLVVLGEFVSIPQERTRRLGTRMAAGMAVRATPRQGKARLC